ncbi:hypothetical protein BV20DRAFT_738324 [Pilatotrama ljubarskyi]|nr:hypothetical protein BV20DRAFT_738324 [Pilatotrama ljubarskyi]
MENDQTTPVSAYPPRDATQPHLTKQTLASHNAADRGVAHPLHAPLHSVGSPFSSLGTGSSASFGKPAPLSSTNVTSPSAQSKTQSPDPLETLPKLVESPVVLPKLVGPTAVSSINPPPSSRSGQSSGDSARPRSSGSSTSESDGHVGPTRASIRAWAKATPAGPPRGTPSGSSPSDSTPSGSTPDLPHGQSGSDDNLSRVSLTHSAAPPVRSPESSIDAVSSGSGDESPGNGVEAEESSGNVADGESSGSEHASRSPPTTSPSPPPEQASIQVRRESLAPYPHSSIIAPPHHHSSLPRHHPHHAHAHTPHPRPPLAHSQFSSDSLPPAPNAAHQDQRERLDRRQHRHSHSGRHRHRERERDRDRDRDRRSRTLGSNPSIAPPAPIPASGRASLDPLPPPPPPLRPLRVSSGNGTDVFEEMVKMLMSSRRPLLRAGGAENGWIPLTPPPRRQNDVLDDIWQMIQWSSRDR